MDQVQRTLDGLAEAGRWLAVEVASFWFLLQLSVILGAALICWAVGALVRRRIDPLDLTMGWPPMLRLALRAVLDRTGLILFVAAAFTAQAVIAASTWPSNGYLVGIAAKLASAWLAIGLLASVIRNKFLFRAVAVSAFLVAALSIVGLLERATAGLDAVAIVIGGLRVSLLLALKTAALMLVAVWFAVALANFADRRLQAAADLTPALQVLIGKLLRLGLISLAVVIVVSAVGIDLTALAFLSGAIGVGIGFGLQKIVSNLISGIILLADKSIKPGDIISVGDRFGWVEELGARYTAVSTRDGREYLIPNEDLVTQSVVNWSHTSQDIRLEVKFGTGYDCDPHKVIAVATGAVRGMPRVLDEPPPVCFLTEFGDSALNFSLGFWMSDPAQGIGNLRSDVMLALWDALKREGITIPYPQRDLHLKTPAEVVLRRPPAGGAA